MSKLVRIIIPHKNRHDHLAACLSSIPDKVEVAVMCGGTFAYNCNAGAREGAFTRTDSRERYIFLNDDVVLPDDALGFLQALVEGPGDITGCKVVPPPNAPERAPSQPNFISGAYVELSPESQQPGSFMIYGVDHIPELKRRAVAIPAGCCFAMDVAIFHEVGAFNEQFVNGYEDVDLFLRTLEAGYCFGWLPEDRFVVHHQGQSEGRYDHHGRNLQLFSELWTMERLSNIVPR